MALYVNTNVSSLNAQRKLTNATNNLNVSYQRLASGLRINSAKDDAAGLLISNRLTAQINGLEQGNRNTNDGIALAQTIEGALNETSNMLQRIRTLAVQAANGTYSQADRDALQLEVTALCEEISRIGEKTTFAGARVLDGKEFVYTKAIFDDSHLHFAYAGQKFPINLTLTKNLLGTSGILTFQVGSNHDDTISLDLANGFTMSGILQTAIDNGLDLGTTNPNVVTHTGIINDGCAFKFPSENPRQTTSGLVKYLISAGDNIDDDIAFDFSLDPNSPYLKESPDHYGLRWSVSSQSTAQMTLQNIDSFIHAVDSVRADLGALQNRMESTIRNQSSIAENEADARSRIRDTDFAVETANLTQNTIIQQASQSILAQANQRPQIALSFPFN